MSSNKESILIFVGEEAGVSLPEARRGLGEKIKAAAGNVSEVAVSKLQENMQNFLKSLDTVMSLAPHEVGGLTLDEVELHVQIDGKGNIGIIGALGAEFAAHGGIKLVLRKKSNHNP